MKRSFILFGLLALVLIVAFTVYAVEYSTWGKTKATFQEEDPQRLARPGGKEQDVTFRLAYTPGSDVTFLWPDGTERPHIDVTMDVTANTRHIWVDMRGQPGYSLADELMNFLDLWYFTSYFGVPNQTDCWTDCFVYTECTPLLDAPLLHHPVMQISQEREKGQMLALVVIKYWFHYEEVRNATPKYILQKWETLPVGVNLLPAVQNGITTVTGTGEWETSVSKGKYRRGDDGQCSKPRDIVDTGFNWELTITRLTPNP